MRTLRLSLAGTVILALLGGLGGAAVAQSEPLGPSVRSDILPGVELAVIEVEPGVYQVIDDSVRDLARANDFDIVAGHDGGIWLLRPKWFFRLGTQGARMWPTETPKHAAFEVASDGTVWVQARDGLQSFDGEGWTSHDGHWGQGTLEVAPDGTVWSTWGDPERPGPVFGYLDDDGWQAVGDGAVTGLLVASPDDIWATVPTWVFGFDVRFVDGAWQRLVGFEGAEPTWQRAEDTLADDAHPFNLMGLGRDGTAWLTNDRELVRFDGSEWSRWSLPDTGSNPFLPLEVAPDGSIWSASGSDCQGVGHFDGETWDHYLPGLCVKAIDITADGAVWLLAKESDDNLRHVYVITPEAVASTE